ncbi:hypothetical protein R5H30_01390 [Sulfitobacter sp. D35]|uniref:hypothetical protein n=1 Tax=Sulfitobacter sp. D35 TaxID=3083252 RepID=UPI00296F2AD2|nr:hypothetical protein [Sulfitobacter sp. D35]MDW4496619.1 hypothetical protein [Sulfitobacter sp. D35]
MTTPDPKDDIAGLDALFAAARAAPPEPSADLAARVLADARAAQGSRRFEPATRQDRSGLGNRLRQALRGWRAAGGLAVAVCAGFWIGVSNPAMVPGVETVLYGDAAVDAEAELMDLTGLGWQIEEGFDDAG